MLLYVCICMIGADTLVARVGYIVASLIYARLAIWFSLWIILEFKAGIRMCMR